MHRSRIMVELFKTLDDIYIRQEAIQIDLATRLDEILKKQKNIHVDISTLKKEIKKMSVELDNLTAKVAEMKTVEQSAVALLAKLAEMIRASINDPVALRQLAADLDAQRTELADAVVANTPVEQ